MKLLQVISALIIVLLSVACDSHPKLEPNSNDWKPTLTNQHANIRTMVIAFDSSGSMSGDKLDQAKRATKMYISSLPQDVEIGMVEFGGNARKIADIGTSRDSIIKTINDIVAGGSTPMASAVYKSYFMLADAAKKHQAQGEYHLVIVTDGEADDEELLTRDITTIVEQTPIRVFTIGFQVSLNNVLNKPGPQIRYVSAENEEELRKGFGKVLLEEEEPVKK